MHSLGTEPHTYYLPSAQESIFNHLKMKRICVM